MATRALSASTLAVLVAAGCATLEPERQLADVQRLAGERARGEVVWDANASARAEIDARVAQLLHSELTPESAVQVALLRNRSLQAALAELGIADAEVVQAGLLANPLLSAEVRFGISGSGTGAELGLVQAFMSILQIPLRKRVAAAHLEVTKLEVGGRIFALTADVRSAFYESQGAEQMLELRRTVLEAVELAADLARRQHDAGNISDLELANQRALFEEARLAVAEVEVEAFERREALTALLGLWGQEARWSAAPRLPALPPQDPAPRGLETLAVERRLDLAAARQETVAASADVALTRFFRLLPDTEVGASAEREADGGDWSLGPSLALPLPVFDQGQARLASARGRERQREAEFAALAVQIRSEVRLASARLDAARRRVAFYERVVLPLRQRILSNTQLEYNGMIVGVYQLLQAKRDEIDAGRGYVDSLRDYWVSRVDLERALGTELPPGDAAQKLHSH